MNSELPGTEQNRTEVRVLLEFVLDLVIIVTVIDTVILFNWN